MTRLKNKGRTQAPGLVASIGPTRSV